MQGGGIGTPEVHALRPNGYIFIRIRDEPYFNLWGGNFTVHGHGSLQAPRHESRGFDPSSIVMRSGTGATGAALADPVPTSPARAQELTELNVVRVNALLAQVRVEDPAPMRSPWEALEMPRDVLRATGTPASGFGGDEVVLGDNESASTQSSVAAMAAMFEGLRGDGEDEEAAIEELVEDSVTVGIDLADADAVDASARRPRAHELVRELCVHALRACGAMVSAVWLGAAF